ncbi:hypothetical protein PoB_004108600 [Plakobranchus ocellatus]|uniref:Secreted protein n=1 Tax=Plakobranchus ocellatus TaxID=259542 RepID=A0AAV4B6Z7_9GAST|nr:hypothetical protein PoB_004108600 [Plakobranchus ocellatus]
MRPWRLVIPIFSYYVLLFCICQTGAKPGKHARNPSAGGDGSPLAKRSPKSTSTKRSEVASSPEHSATQTGDDPRADASRGAGDAGPSQGVDIIEDPNSSEKENIDAESLPPSSSTKGGGKKSKRDADDRTSPGREIVVENGLEQEEDIELEESIVASQQTPVRMEQQQQQHMEPLTPLVINDNQEVSVPPQRHGRHHKPQATSTPAANGQFRTPPLSKLSHRVS